MFAFHEGIPSLLEQFPFGLAVCDENGNILDINMEFCRIIALPAEASPQRILLDFAAPEHRDLLKKHLQRAFSAGRVGPTELELCTNDGIRVPVRVFSYVFSKVGGAFVWIICQDISGEREVLAKLFENEERLQLAVDGGELGVWDWDISSGRMAFSSGWVKQLGYSPSEFGSNVEAWEKLCHPEDREQVWHSLEEHFTNKTASYEIEHRMRHASGSWRWILTRGKVIERGPLGKALRMVGVYIDVTSQRQAAEALRDAQAAAEKAVRAKTEFLANVSHEIRTPLNGITGAGQLLLDTELSTPQKELVRILQTSSTALLAVVNDILDLSRAEYGKLDLRPVPASIEQCAKDTLEILRQRISEKRLSVSLNFDPILQELHIFDAVRMRQVFLNLIGNACKFTPAAGSISLGGVVEEQTDEETVATIFVQDTGIGIPTEFQSAIFEPFTQIDSTSGRNIGGAGLGLTICRRLLGLMKSELHVDSTVGSGSKFYFSLKLARHVEPSLPAVTDTIPSKANASTAAPRRRVLVVEDNLVNQRVCRFILQGAGASVTVAADGAEAINFLRHETFDLVLLDLHLPEMDGYEVASSLREIERSRTRRTPIIAVSADVLPGVKERCLASGMDSYIAKPFDRQLLLTEIERLCSNT